MDHGNPLGNGWFAFNGAVGGGGISPERHRPPARARWQLLARDRLGLGRHRRLLRRLRAHEPVRPVRHRVLQLLDQPRRRSGLHPRDQPPGRRQRRRHDRRPTAAHDDEFQYNCVVSATGPCAVAGGGWQLVSIPLDDFFDDNSFLTGGNGVLDPTPPARGGNGELINVVVAVIGGWLRRQLPHRLLDVQPPTRSCPRSERSSTTSRTAFPVAPTATAHHSASTRSRARQRHRHLHRADPARADASGGGDARTTCCR